MLYAEIDDSAVRETIALLDAQIGLPETAELGRVAVRTDIESSIGPFLHLPGYQTRYPGVVTRALGDLYGEYNQAFDPLVEANTEWPTDYQYTRRGPESAPINAWVQIDMVGLPQGFLDQAVDLDQDTVRETLRTRIFEIENSLANYQLLGRIHAHEGESTCFDQRFRASLDDVRQQYGKPVALLATTEDKYQAIKASEFGKSAAEALPDDEVRRLSGFDRLFSPSEFLEHLEGTGGDSEYLLYVRSSDPVAKLRKPDTVIENPLLGDEDTRRTIKAHAVTLNIDRPDLPLGSDARINDTKAYMPPMGMALRVDVPQDVYTVQQGEPPVIELDPRLKDYLLAQGVDPGLVHAGEVECHAKPMQAAYGCYGHVALRTYSKSDRRKLNAGLRQRGPYVIQPEMATPVITNATDGQQYTYVDRNFLSTDGVTYTYMGGFRSLMPVDSTEAEKGRVHGSSDLVWAEIC